MAPLLHFPRAFVLRLALIEIWCMAPYAIWVSTGATPAAIVAGGVTALVAAAAWAAALTQPWRGKARLALALLATPAAGPLAGEVAARLAPQIM